MLSTLQSRRSRGFTLIELLVVLAIMAFLAAMSYPSCAKHIYKARRVMAVAQLMLIEQAEERWRSSNAAYGDLSDIGVSKQSAGESYLLSISVNKGFAYTATAIAQGSQDGDQQCRYMRLIVANGNSTTASGADDKVANDFLANNRCWLK